MNPTTNAVSLSKIDCPVAKIVRQAVTGRPQPAEEELLRRATPLVGLVGLMWDYTNTVLDLASQMRIKELRGASREIRAIKEKFFAKQDSLLCLRDDNAISELAEKVEPIFQEHLTKLSWGLKNDMKRHCADLSERYRPLLQATYTALVILRAQRLCAARFAKWLRERNGSDHFLNQPTVNKLEQLLTLYTGDFAMPSTETMNLTARIIFNEMVKYEQWLLSVAPLTHKLITGNQPTPFKQLTH